MLGLSRDLLEQLAFYGSYHRNRWNQLIHFVFVPLIVVSAMVWACYTGPLFGINLPDLAARAVPESIAQCVNLPPPPGGARGPSIIMPVCPFD